MCKIYFILQVLYSSFYVFYLLYLRLLQTFKKMCFALFACLLVGPPKTHCLDCSPISGSVWSIHVSSIVINCQKPFRLRLNITKHYFDVYNCEQSRRTPGGNLFHIQMISWNIMNQFNWHFHYHHIFTIGSFIKISSIFSMVSEVVTSFGRTGRSTSKMHVQPHLNSAVEYFIVDNEEWMLQKLRKSSW